MIYYYPNRPILIPPDPENPLNPTPFYIKKLEATAKFVAEQKWNGDNTEIYTEDLSFWNRRGEKHRYVPTQEILKSLNLFPKGSIINLELMHYRTKTIKHTMIVHSLLGWEGKSLIGKSWGDARLILEEFFRSKTWRKGGCDQVRLSPVWKSGFWDLFQQADGEIIEGIILKDPKGKLKISATKIPDVPWMMKIRKPSKKYQF